MNLTTRLATTAGAFVAAGVTAKVVSDRHRTQRRLRRGDDVPFGSVHSTPLTVLATDGVALNVEVDEGPRKTPTVVFLHGWMCDLDSWHFPRLALRGQVRMVFMDHRSHGRSGRSYADNSSLADLAEDVRTVLREVVPRGPVVLVGHSMGGMTIMELAAADPKLFERRVKGVVLVSTSSGRLLRRSPGIARLTPLVRAAGPLLDWGRTFNSYSIMRRWAVGPNAPERYVDMSDEMILRAPTHVVADFYPNFVSLDESASLPAMGTAVTKVLCGTADQLTPPRHSRVLAEEIPGATLELVEDAGHMLVFEGHEQVTQAVQDVLEAIS